MQRLIIHNVGPIKDADVWLKKVNVFIGPQSSGKSTVAKVISFCSWLEKNKHELEGSFLFANSVIDKMISYHRMEGQVKKMQEFGMKVDKLVKEPMYSDMGNGFLFTEIHYPDTFVW